MQRRGGAGEVSFFKIAEDSWQETANKTLEIARQKVNAQKLRSLDVLLGLTENTPFDVRGLNGGFNVLRLRLNRNGTYFLANYALFLLGAIAISIITSPESILCIVGISLGWWFVLKATLEQDIRVSTLTITRKQACTLMSLVTAFLGFNLIKSIFTWIFWLSLVCIIAHASLRNEKSFTFEEDSYVNVETGGSGSTSEQHPEQN